MKLFYFLLVAIITHNVTAQIKISGNVLDDKQKQIYGANVFLDGTYDGALTDIDGNFSFETDETGVQLLKVTFLDHEDYFQKIEISKDLELKIILKSNINQIDVVTINAGMMQSGDKAKVAVLKPLDIVTTAGSAGDIVAALQTLPGTQVVGEDGRLFVRGGEAEETQTYIDGLRVSQPYGATTNNLPSRGRFSPFLFSGISFSTGGYSSEYGEALSGILLLDTEDEARQNQTDISLMTVGLGLSNTQKWKKSSLSLSTSYIDLSPYQAVVPETVDWNRPYQTLAGESVYRYHFAEGILKIYTAFDASKFDLNQKNINYQDPIRVSMHNKNLYFNSVYKGYVFQNWQLHTGLSYGLSDNDLDLDLNRVNNTEHAFHFKFKIDKKLTSKIKWLVGTDYFRTNFDENYSAPAEKSDFGFKSDIWSLYTDLDFGITNNFVLKTGIRVSKNYLLDEFQFNPRISFALRSGKFSTTSFAYGTYLQAPGRDYLKYYSDLKSEKTQHYIFNYLYSKKGQTLRAEIYYKSYRDLVKYDTFLTQFNSEYNNKGFGYAKGVDFFWRDNQTFKMLEYWISYAFIDTQRDYKNYSYEVTPPFVAKHTASLVTKYWINSLRSQAGFTYTFNSGRPYHNPNEQNFMQGKTKNYNNLSASWAYLISPQKILYFSVSNVLGHRNVFGYEYANQPDQNGVYPRQVILPTADRFYFVGLFWTISNDKKTNQLDKL